MPWKKNKQTQNPELAPNNKSTDQEDLRHQAYMLVRHLQACYPDSTKDEELLLRLTRLFDHQFSPNTVEHLVEALRRPFTQPSTTRTQVPLEDSHIHLGLDSLTQKNTVTATP